MENLSSHQINQNHENDFRRDGLDDLDEIDNDLLLMVDQNTSFTYNSLEVSEKWYNLITNFEKRWTLNTSSFKMTKYSLPYNISDVDSSIDWESDVIFKNLKDQIWWFKEYFEMSVDERLRIMPSIWELRRKEKSAQEFIDLWYEMPLAFNVTWLANNLNVDEEECWCASNEELASMRAEMAKQYIIKELKPYMSEELLEQIIYTDSQVLSEDPNWWTYESIPWVEITMITWVPTVSKTHFEWTNWKYHTTIKDEDIYLIDWKEYAILENWSLLDENDNWLPDDAYEIKVWNNETQYIEHEEHWDVELIIL